MKKIKILYILSSLNICNGIASYTMNYFRNIDLNKFEIEFIIDDTEYSEYVEEIKNKKCNIYYIPKISIKHIISSIKRIKQFYKEHNDYDIIHCNVVNLGAFYLYYAKKAGIKTRILHSHATKYAEKKIRVFRNKILAIYAKKFANVYFACSKLAGDFLFKNKKYYIINNAIDIERYKYNEEIRKEIRKICKIKENQYVIGHIGRFSEQKNHDFIINVMKKLKEKRADIVLILIGTGHLQKRIKKKVTKEGLEKNVIFKNNIKNVNDYLQAMDLFILPSKFEGFPVVGIEAQVNGLPCLFSDKITKEIRLNSNAMFLKINESQKWCDVILNENLKRINIENKDFDNYTIESASKILEDIYNKLAIK